MRSISLGLLVVAFLATSVGEAPAFQSGNQTAIQQATQAELICIGKVVDLEPELQTLELSAGAKISCAVASVQVEEWVLGGNGLTNIRVAQLTRQRGINSPEMLARRRRPTVAYGRQPEVLSVGQQACFFLRKHPTADCFVPVSMDLPLEKCDPNYANDLGGIRKIAKVLETPIESLQSKEAADRQLAACSLILRYRAEPLIALRPSSNEPVSVEESKLILLALSEMKWGEMPFDQYGSLTLHNVFTQLQLTEKEGWKQPTMNDDDDFNFAMGDAAVKWMKTQAGKYRIQRSAGNSRKMQ